MQISNLLKTATLIGLASSAPVEKRATSASDLVLAIMPGSDSCTTTDQCRTAVQAAPYLINAMNTYGVTKPVEIAGILALVGFESVDMEYKINTNAANAAGGQGTSNMQQGHYNVDYANSIPALKSQNPSTSTVLDLVTPDEYNFGTGPWFYSTNCAAAKIAAATATPDAWWTEYMSCVGVVVTTDRTAYWTRAKTAFGL